MPISIMIAAPLAGAILLALSAGRAGNKAAGTVGCAAVLVSLIAAIRASWPLFVDAFPSLASSAGGVALERTAGGAAFVSEHLYTWFAVDRLSVDLFDPAGVAFVSDLGNSRVDAPVFII